MFKKILFLTFFLLISQYSFAEQKVNVLFDEGHGQAFHISKDGPLHLSRLAELLKEEGFNVSSSTAHFDDSLFQHVDAIIISGPFKPFDNDEISQLLNFVGSGGKLIIMLHISQPAKELFEKFGVHITKGAISENENIINSKKTDFYIKDFMHHTLTSGLKSFAVYGSWGFFTENSNVKLVAKSSNNSWIDFNRNRIHDENEPKGPFGIIATGTLGKGSFVFFSDDAIFQNGYLKDENLELAKNLSKFLRE